MTRFALAWLRRYQQRRHVENNDFISNSTADVSRTCVTVWIENADLDSDNRDINCVSPILVHKVYSQLQKTTWSQNVQVAIGVDTSRLRTAIVKISVLLLTHFILQCFFF